MAYKCNLCNDSGVQKHKAWAVNIVDKKTGEVQHRVQKQDKDGNPVFNEVPCNCGSGKPSPKKKSK